ncbi:hypothetical protein MNBD_GAMMA12-2523 [hydrothermal vent metagenome]|uniref:Uncharacterized protein n=1 Tax=hydrothermal vent metagenome TaxID=652676 RepID=A0A3B0YBB2_9ZZZZ
MKFDELKTEYLSEFEVRLLVNDRPLLELVKEQEILHSRKEFYEREKEEPEFDATDPDFLAGDYMNMNPGDTYLPCRNLLDDPMPIGFEIDEWDPILKKSTLLYCSCGIPDCWLFRCRITERDNIVVWSDFDQFHRGWCYDMGPLIFEKDKYIEALTKV